MAKEWVISEEDLGCDGAYLSREEVIRCGDCKYYTEAHTTRFFTIPAYCDIFAGEDMVGELKPNDFCSRGERRTDNA